MKTGFFENMRGNMKTGVLVIMISILATCGNVLGEDKPRITLAEAVNIAKKEIPGKVLETELEDGVYEIKIRTENGEKIKVKIDPNDGTIIRKGLMIRDFSNKGFHKHQN